MAASEFKPMTSISKNPDYKDLRYRKCSDWVATEKVHGSSFQMFSSDGKTLEFGSRTRHLDKEGSFLKCNLRELMKKYKDYALKLWNIVNSEDEWSPYRAAPFGLEEVDEYDVDSKPSVNKTSAVNNTSVENNTSAVNNISPVNNTLAGESDKEGPTDVQNDLNVKECHVRIYGELYGGGGINEEVRNAVQKEIIYCDDFRFYVFGITINFRWVTITELNKICERAGFPYFAKPLCEPKQSVDEMKEYLTDNGFIALRSALTEKIGNEKTSMEGVVITPLVRPDFRLHAYKFLFPAFSDVRKEQFGKTQTANYCTKQRYHSVISKLDIPERENTGMVLDLYIKDVLKESENKNPGAKLISNWQKMVVAWLAEDEYVSSEFLRKFIEDERAKFAEIKNKGARVVVDEEFIRKKREEGQKIREEREKKREERERERRLNEEMATEIDL